MELKILKECFKKGILNEHGKNEILKYIEDLERKNEKLENTVVYLEDIIKKLSLYIEDKRC